MYYCKSLNGLELIKACEKVILSHFPMSSYSKEAIDIVRNECEKFTDERERLYCYETLRSSIIQIKSFYQPYEVVLKEIEPEIAHLRTIEYIKWKYNRISMQDYDRIYKDNLIHIKHENFPLIFWSFIVVFSLLGWIASVLFIILIGLKNAIKKLYIIMGSLSFVIFFSLWIIGLWMA